ncbi:hypothetical protein [Sporosarcina sp. FSL K6-2383]|uniref:hypothetical protein n=1 Tax=Sporosarcina sp. FSL K6-2383 TaxID=2921556 RepID=UPI003159CB9B
MQQERYDEFQVAKRHRYGHHAFFLTIVLIFVNGLIKMNYIWAEPLIEMLVLMSIPSTYMVVMTILNGAYMSRKDKNTYLYIPMFGFVSLFSLFVIGQAIWSDVFAPIKDGRLDNSASILFIAANSISMTIAMIVRRRKDSRMIREEA